jgi:hypothetical protein
MKVKLFVTMLATPLLMLSSVCFAENGPTVSLASSNNDALMMRIDALESELTALQAAFQKEGDKGGYCDAGCATSSWMIGAEVAFLKPHVGAPGLIGPRFDYAPAYRVYVGYETADGLGVKATWFDFDDDTTPPVWGLQTHAADVEVTQRATFCNWDLQLGAGVEYAKVDLTVVPFFPVGPIRPAAVFEGFGPTVSLAARRPIGCSGLALVGNVRASWLYGQTRAPWISTFLPVDVESHFAMASSAQIGVEWATQVNCNTLFVRGLWEVQAWEIASVLGALNADIGYTGPTVAVGIAR